MGFSVYQGADIGECLVTAKQINNGDFESWYNQWHKIAVRIHAIADECNNKKHYESAKSAYLRASNYYRTAEFYLHGNPKDERINDASRKSRECFLNYANLHKPYIEPVQIPYENTKLPGYFYYPQDNQKKPRPTIIIQTGFDGTQEELYVYALEAVKRGYNALTFEGPGQGAVLREQHVPFRADWEHVITPVIDYLASRADVDINNIALYGLSYGGYLAPRAASFDTRIKFLIANSGIYDPLEAMLSHFKKFAKTKDELVAFIKKHPNILNQVIKGDMSTNTLARWFFQHGMYAFASNSPSDFLLKLSEWTMKGLAEKIKSTTLICESENEMPEIKGQAQILYDHIHAPKTFMLFKTDEGAGYHCQMGALLLSNQRIFDWLDEAIRA
jgi:esterase/lipase